MRLLLDTHAFLWFVAGDPKLPASARSAIEAPDNQIFFSAASAWEMAIKISLGKLKIAEPVAQFLPRELRQNGFIWLPVDLAHTVVVATLPFEHRDPFDRLLTAQCLTEGMPIISGDPAFDAYTIKRVWQSSAAPLSPRAS